jgi:hypothetical protein
MRQCTGPAAAGGGTRQIGRGARFAKHTVDFDRANFDDPTTLVRRRALTIGCF